MSEARTISELSTIHRLAADDYARHGDFVGAGEVFDEVLSRSDVPPADPEQYVPWIALRASAFRDRGFNVLRQSLHDDNFSEAVADTASDRIMDAYYLTAPYVEDPDGNVPGLTVPEQRRLSSEHGKTLGRIGRLIGTTQVMMGDLTLREPASEILREEQQSFEDADGYLANGDNSLAGATNAIMAARMEVANGESSDEVRRWVRRAGIYVLGLYDSEGKSDHGATRWTVARELPGLRSRRAAMRRMTDWRTV